MWIWKIESAAGKRTYHVSMMKTVVKDQLTVPLRDANFCTCIGHRELAKAHPDRPCDRICKHSAFFLLEILRQRKIEKASTRKIGTGSLSHLAIVDGTTSKPHLIEDGRA